MNIVSHALLPPLSIDEPGVAPAMSKQFIISALAPRRVDQAFPLVQAAHGVMTPECWRDLAGKFLAEEFGLDGAEELADREIGGEGIAGGLDLSRPPGNGIYVCATEHGSLRGLFCYRVGKTGSQGPLGRRLSVPIFVAIGLFDTIATAEALREAMEKLALNLRCGSVSIDLAGCRLSSLAPAIDAWEYFSKQGYEAENRTLIRSLTSEQSFPHFARA